MYVNRPCKALHSLKQTLFHPGGKELTPQPRECGAEDKIRLVYIDVNQHSAGFAIRNEIPVSLSCLVHEFEIQG